MKILLCSPFSFLGGGRAIPYSTRVAPSLVLGDLGAGVVPSSAESICGSGLPAYKNVCSFIVAFAQLTFSLFFFSFYQPVQQVLGVFVCLFMWLVQYPKDASKEPQGLDIITKSFVLLYLHYICAYLCVVVSHLGLIMSMLRESHLVDLRGPYVRLEIGHLLPHAGQVPYPQYFR